MKTEITFRLESIKVDLINKIRDCSSIKEQDRLLRNLGLIEIALSKCEQSDNQQAVILELLSVFAT